VPRKDSCFGRMYFISVVDGNKRDKGRGVVANNGSAQKRKKKFRDNPFS
jgi:hypothetical protein